jgi:hypothetical protein
MKLSGDPETLQRFVKHVPLSSGFAAQAHNKYGVPCSSAYSTVAIFIRP